MRQCTRPTSEPAFRVEPDSGQDCSDVDINLLGLHFARNDKQRCSIGCSSSNQQPFERCDKMK